MNKDWREWLEEEKTKVIEEKWDFSLFKIVCNKCNSNNTEINGEGDKEYGYYNESYMEGIILVKCHECGNAMCIKIGDYFDFEGINKENDALVSNSEEKEK